MGAVTCLPEGSGLYGNAVGSRRPDKTAEHVQTRIEGGKQRSGKKSERAQNGRVGMQRGVKGRWGNAAAMAFQTMGHARNLRKLRASMAAPVGAG